MLQCITWVAYRWKPEAMVLRNVWFKQVMTLTRSLIHIRNNKCIKAIYLCDFPEMIILYSIFCNMFIFTCLTEFWKKTTTCGYAALFVLLKLNG